MKTLAMDFPVPFRSALHRLDPRAKIVAFFLASLAFASVPVGQLRVFVPFYFLVAILLVASRVPLRYLGYRCLLASPFILTAVAVFQLSVLVETPALVSQAAASPIVLTVQIQSWELGLSILLKAYGAVVLISLLTGTCSLNELLWGLHRLRAPKALVLTATLMFRYLFLLNDEWQRTTRARESRTPGVLRMSLLKVYGRQLAMIFLRSWERADRVQAAMASRGFRNELPTLYAGRFGRIDACFVAGVPLLFLGIRLMVS
jgi:cobalt/nickel transport system permease protein